MALEGEKRQKMELKKTKQTQLFVLQENEKKKLFSLLTGSRVSTEKKQLNIKSTEWKK